MFQHHPTLVDNFFSPENKLNIVKALQLSKKSVAMTGDGVNGIYSLLLTTTNTVVKRLLSLDAPAIKAADVGIAMGIGGTEITKQAADIVLADDNFRTIVSAVEEGRRVFDNIMKFIVYLLSCNSAEIWIFLLSAVFDVHDGKPFTTNMVLWANIIADVPPAMSLGMEPPEKNVMHRKPRNPNQSVLNWMSSSLILIQGFGMTMLTLGALLFSTYYYPKEQSEDMSRSVAFVLLTCLQLMQAFYTRSLLESVFVTGIFGNPYMVFAVTLSFMLMIFGNYFPILQAILGLVPLDSVGWGIVLFGLILHLILCETLKMVIRAVNRRKESSGEEELLPKLNDANI
jgi:Ca2+-transporting ATPase